MLELPVISWDITAVEVLAAVVMFVVGYVTHEAMHIGVLEALREPYSIEFLPDGFRGLIPGPSGAPNMVSVDMERILSKRRMTIVSLSPIVATAPPLAAWIAAFMYPVVDAGVLLVIFLWFSSAAPIWDAVNVALYDPEKRLEAEVAA